MNKLNIVLVLFLAFSVAVSAKKFVPWQEPVIAVHAGGDSGAPANTMTAIKKSAALGCKYFEIDIRSTKDDVIILMHDETLERTTDCWGPVKGCDWETIRNTDNGSYINPNYKDARIPTLEEVLVYAKKHDLYLILDICDSTAAGKKLYDLLKKYDMLDRAKSFWRAGTSKYKLTLYPKVKVFKGSLLPLYGRRKENAAQIIAKFKAAKKAYAGRAGVLLNSYEPMTRK